MLPSLGLSADKSVCAEMASDEYNKVLVLMAYSFAVRIPVLRGLRGASGPLTDSQLDKIYSAVMAMGAENYRNAVPESYEDMKALAKREKSFLLTVPTGSRFMCLKMFRSWRSLQIKTFSFRLCGSFVSAVLAAY